MDARAIIGKIRRNQEVSDAELRWFTNGLAYGQVSDAQAGAFAMSVCLNGLGPKGRIALTKGMRDSGDVLDWALDGPILDKHSTGGVGDCVSLVLAPALAACGVYVPMISGRGLGHTGGTLDKLEAIPGVKTTIPTDKMRRIVGDVGCAIVGATGSIAPADKRLYAVRDVTATVESIDLITASILSKKLAAGLDGLVMDVKVGAGAFMKSVDEAKTLARALVDVACGAGCPTTALITEMDAPLAPALGNALEVAAAMEVLSGNAAAAPRLHALTLELGAAVLTLHGIDGAASKMQTAITSGAALAKFAQMIAAMGGPPDMAEDWRTHLAPAPIVGAVVAPTTGHIAAINGEALGLTVVALGGGRQVESDRIDPRVGLSDVVPLGAQVTAGDPLCMVHAASHDAAEAAAIAVQSAIRIGGQAPAQPLVIERVS